MSWEVCGRRRSSCGSITANRQVAARTVHCWPFDGWVPKAGVHVIAEVYPSLWRGRHPAAGQTPDQQDAYTTSRWLQESDLAGKLAQFFQPSLTADERAVAELEGWILGVADTGTFQTQIVPLEGTLCE